MWQNLAPPIAALTQELYCTLQTNHLSPQYRPDRFFITALQTALAQIAQYFTIQKIIVTNNRTYGTFTLTTPKILP